MRQSRLTLRCTTEAEVRALREQVDEGTVRVPDELVEFGAEVEIDVQLPGGAGALLTGITGTSGALGVSVAIDPPTPNARDAIERAARELDPPTKPRPVGYGLEPETARMARIEVPAEAFRDDLPPPPPPPPVGIPKIPPPIPKLPPSVAKLRAQTSPGVRTGALAPREPTPPPRKIEPPEPPPPPPPPPPAVVVPPIPVPVAAPVRAPTDPPVAETAEELLDAGRLADALVAFQRRVKASHHDRAAAVGVEIVEGIMARERGDRFEAAQRFEAALAIDPDDTRAAHELTEIRRAVVEARLAGLTKLVEKKDD